MEKKKFCLYLRTDLMTKADNALDQGLIPGYSNTSNLVDGLLAEKLKTLEA